jgi:hypothetical protein
LPSSQRTQAPVPGLVIETEEPALAACAWAATAPKAAELTTLLEMNCRREMRFFICFPPVEHPARINSSFLIEYAR